MSKVRVYDTRFFVEYFYSPDARLISKMKQMLKEDRRSVISPVTIHEVYVLTMRKEGREVAALRAEVLGRDFEVVDVDTNIAVASAELRHKYHIPMADSIIAATGQRLNAPIVTDDEHITKIKEVKAEWMAL